MYNLVKININSQINIKKIRPDQSKNIRNYYDLGVL